MANKEEVIEFLKNCSECELLSVIQELTVEQCFKSKDGAQKRILRQYLLASTSYDMEGGEIVTMPIFSFIGKPRDGNNWLSPAAGAGTCTKCKTDVRGFCSHSICPVCDNYVSLT